MAMNKIREHMKTRARQRAVIRHSRRQLEPLLHPSELYPRQVHLPR